MTDGDGMETGKNQAGVKIHRILIPDPTGVCYHRPRHVGSRGHPLRVCSASKWESCGRTSAVRLVACQSRLQAGGELVCQAKLQTTVFRGRLTAWPMMGCMGEAVGRRFVGVARTPRWVSRRDGRTTPNCARRLSAETCREVARLSRVPWTRRASHECSGAFLFGATSPVARRRRHFDDASAVTCRRRPRDISQFGDSRQGI
jgi:hypothetical protein